MTSTVELKAHLIQDLKTVLKNDEGTTVHPLLLQGPPGIGISGTSTDAAKEVAALLGMTLKVNPLANDPLDRHDLVVVDVEIARRSESILYSVVNGHLLAKDILDNVIDLALVPAGGSVLRIDVDDGPHRAETLQEIDQWFCENQDRLRQHRILTNVIAKGPTVDVSLNHLRPVTVSAPNLDVAFHERSRHVFTGQSAPKSAAERELFNRVEDQAMNERLQTAFPSLGALGKKLDAQASKATVTNEVTQEPTPTRRQP